MSDQVVTTLTIDADTSGAAQYEQAMSGAEKAANSTAKSASDLGLQLAGIGAAGVGLVAGLNAGMDRIVSANKELADLTTTAKLVGLSLADIQGVQFGGHISGLTDSQINQGLERSAQLLNDASRNSNTLSKELDANGISIKNANGQLISQNQLLGIAGDLIKNARPGQDQVAIAQMLGFTKEWIPLLQQGSVAMSGLTAEAKKAGAVIDDETISRANDFDREWRKSSVEFSATMRSALLGLLPYADDLVDRLSKFVRSIDVAKIAAAADEHAQAVLKPDEDALKAAGVGAISIGITPDTQQAIKDLQNSSIFSLEFWSSAGRAFAGAVNIIRPEDVKWAAGADPVRDTSPATMQVLAAKANEAQWTSAGAAWGKYQSAIVSGAEAMAHGLSNVAGRGTEANDAVDRAINTLRRHTEQQFADANAQGQGVAAFARLRAEAAETAAVLANGGKETSQQARDFDLLKQRAEGAAVALERAKIASSIKFGGDTAFLSQGDVAIATQLKGLYPDVADALASVEAAALRVNKPLRPVNDNKPAKEREAA